MHRTPGQIAKFRGEIGRKPGSIIDQEIPRRVCTLPLAGFKENLAAARGWKCILRGHFAVLSYYQVCFTRWNPRSVSIRGFDSTGNTLQQITTTLYAVKWLPSYVTSLLYTKELLITLRMYNSRRNRNY